MAPLLAVRIIGYFPFLVLVVNYSGALMAAGAEDIEVVDDLTSQAFLFAFTYFIGRRGQCTELYKDKPKKGCFNSITLLRDNSDDKSTLSPADCLLGRTLHEALKPCYPV